VAAAILADLVDLIDHLLEMGLDFLKVIDRITVHLGGLDLVILLEELDTLLDGF
jgi:hypothetical protein